MENDKVAPERITRVAAVTAGSFGFLCTLTIGVAMGLPNEVVALRALASSSVLVLLGGALGKVLARSVQEASLRSESTETSEDIPQISKE